MTYGLSCVNSSGEYTISSDGFLFGYLGKATYSSTTAASGDSVSSNAGFDVYTFTWAGPIMVALGLRSSGTAGQRISSVRQSGSTWYITVVDTSTSTEGYSSLYWAQNGGGCDIYVWGVPTSVSGYGVALYNSSGTLTADLSRQPMMFKERPSFATNVMAATIGTYTQPAIIGSPRSFHNIAVLGTGPTPWFNTYYDGVWSWDGSHTLTRGDILTSANHDDGPGPTTILHAATTPTLIEAGGLT